MSFASIDFLLFFVVVLFVTILLQELRRSIWKEAWLLLASYFFYGYWDWRFCILLFAVTVCSYLTALRIQKRYLLIAGITVPLIVLGFFKYFNFFLDSFSHVANQSFDAWNIILPVGISFYTFQALSYIIDVYRKKIEPEQNLVRLALYISFFPQLVAGPIIKASDFLPQLKQNQKVTKVGIEVGIQLMVFGLFKKIVLADHLSVFVDDVFGTPSAFSWISILLAILSYSIQIYFDFSGYSDIAIGCAKCFGYEFTPNFNLPYISESVTIFWRRWHISLSSWLKEYLYIPLGGNRKGPARQYLNLFITMLLGGLWHGANWTFVFWGFIHGIALCIDKLLSKKKEVGIVRRVIGIFGTFIFVSLAWVFFRAENFSQAWTILIRLFTLQAGIIQPFFWTFISLFILALATFVAITKAKMTNQSKIQGFYPKVKLTTIPGLTLFFIACGLTFALAFTGEQPFVYFQF